jgi:carbon monoxide dehydrogenase subunit G
MASDQMETAVAAPADDVWALVGDFGAVGDFLAGIDDLRIEGDDRIISMFGMEIREHLVERDEAARSLTYSLVSGVPVDKHRVTITVVPEGETSVVTWNFEVEPDEMSPLFADTYRQGLAALQAHFA